MGGIDADEETNQEVIRRLTTHDIVPSVTFVGIPQMYAPPTNQEGKPFAMAQADAHDDSAARLAFETFKARAVLEIEVMLCHDPYSADDEISDRTIRDCADRLRAMTFDKPATVMAEPLVPPKGWP